MAEPTFLIPYAPRNAEAAAALASALVGKRPVVLAGEGEIAVPQGATRVDAPGGRGAAIRNALPVLRGDIVVVHEPDCAAADVDALVRPIASDEADAVYVQPRTRTALDALAGRAMRSLAQAVADTPLADPAPPVRAFRTSALRTLELRSDGPEIDAEILVKLAARAFRVRALPIEVERGGDPLPDRLRRMAALLRYASVQNAQDNLHEGYNTLARMDEAPHYNAVIGRKFAPYLGQRVLEIGAGIGTITRQIEQGREKVVALEVDAFYVDRLKNLFRDKPHIHPLLSDVATTDWAALGKEGFDTVVLSNVLEHIEDDAAAVRNFRRVLPQGGRLVVLVPALPAIYGSLDEAVGHFRRYTPQTLTKVIQENGFRLETLEWMNLVGIAGWFLNGRVLRRRAVPPLQLRLYDRVAPLFAQAESKLRIPVGMSLFAVARAGEPA